MPLFDSYLMVDWSAASKPKRGKDSIWWALYSRKDRLRTTGNPATRNAAVKEIAKLLNKETRVLVGFDFPFGYPKGFAKFTKKALSNSEASALDVWDWLSNEIRDGIDNKNKNNRFEVAATLNKLFDSQGPFWGLPNWNPPKTAIECLVPRHKKDKESKKDIVDYKLIGIEEKRIVEKRQKSAQPVWKLNGAGSVGGQTLTGLPALYQLCKQFEGQVKVWPFQTGLEAPEPGVKITLAEIYPSLLDTAMAGWSTDREVKDCTQVRVMAAAFAALDAKDELACLFTLKAAGLNCSQREAVEKEEGWILGVGYEERLRKAGSEEYKG